MSALERCRFNEVSELFYINSTLYLSAVCERCTPLRVVVVCVGAWVGGWVGGCVRAWVRVQPRVGTKNPTSKKFHLRVSNLGVTLSPTRDATFF